MNVRKEICKALFVLHQIKVGPSLLMVKRKNAQMQGIHQLETRALSFLAGYAIEDRPEAILAALSAAVTEVSTSIPRKKPSRGNPGRSKVLNGDIWVLQQHKATGRKIPALVREAQECDPPKLDPYEDVDTHAKRIRDILRSTDI